MEEEPFQLRPQVHIPVDPIDQPLGEALVCEKLDTVFIRLQQSMILAGSLSHFGVV